MTDASNQTSPKRTPLYQWHVDRGGRMVDFAGWEMPVQYTSIVEEHNATRNQVTVFDVSHMGRLRFEGPGAGAFLDQLLTRSVLDMQPGQVRYSLVCNHEGGVLDDVLVYYQETPSGTRYYLLVVNASNREKIIQWIDAQWPDEANLSVNDRTESTAMIAVQGPKAVDVVTPLIKADIASMRYFRVLGTEQMGKPCVVSRTGYTGEDGFELIVRDEHAQQVMENLFASGRQHGITPAGLGARDTLRLESAMPLYGHELNENINPFQVGLDFAVSLTDADGNDRDFIGREALAEYDLENRDLFRIGIVVEGKRPAREGYPVYKSDELIGEVCSGSFSPTLEKPIAMALVNCSTEFGDELEIEVRNQRLPAIVSALPFYKRP